MAEEHTTVGYEAERQARPWLRLAFVLATLTGGLATATQHFAYLFNYHPVLGTQYGHVYFPGMFLIWASRWGYVPG